MANCTVRGKISLYVALFNLISIEKAKIFVNFKHNILLWKFHNGTAGFI